MTGPDQHTPGDVQPNEFTDPIPARYRWLKRILLGFVGLVLLVLAARVAWGVYAHVALQREWRRLQLAGEPIHPEDFDPEPVPDESNAALALQQAAGALNLSTDQRELLLGLADDLEAVPGSLEELTAVMEATGAVREAARAAWRLPAADWGARARSPAPRIAVAPTDTLWPLYLVLAVAPAYHHQRGDDAEALAAVQDLLGVAATYEDNTFRISHYMYFVYCWAACDALEYISPELEIAQLVGGETASAASVEQVHAVIDTLLAEQSFRDVFARNLQFWRMYQIDCVRLCAAGEAMPRFTSIFEVSMGGTPRQRALSYVFCPVLELDGLRLTRYFSAWCAAGRAPDWPSAARAGAADFARANGINHWIRPFTADPHQLDVHVRRHYRALSWRRLAATGLALRLHQTQEGVAASRLADLVPDYLPFVPVDPFAADGRPFSYRPGAEPPLLYGLGENEVDDGGTEDTGRDPNGVPAGDMVFRLHRPPADPNHKPSLRTSMA